ncbi:MAG: shikimate kinase [Halioglobus sp.]|jgi:shikimate kinase
MPGAGKSTVGVLLAKMSGLAFWDTDLEIQVKAGATLQEILEDEGYLKLRAREEQVLMSVPLDDAVISTGGSVVYSEPVMLRLRDAGPVIYLEVDIDELQRRVAQTPNRGIASQSTYKFSDIYDERTPLYRRYAHYTITCSGVSADNIATDILSIVSQESPGA